MRMTFGDQKAPCAPDKGNRQFKAERPKQLGVSEITYVSTWQGRQYAALVIDLFARSIIGWRVSRSMRTDFMLDALEQALHGGQLGIHSDRGLQYFSIRYSERLTEAGVRRKGDRYDNALAETIFELYKAESIIAGYLGRLRNHSDSQRSNGSRGSTITDCWAHGQYPAFGG